MFLLGRRNRLEKESSLQVMVRKRLGARANCISCYGARRRCKSSLCGLARRVGIKRIRLIAYAPGLQRHLMDAIALQIVEWAFRSIHRQLMEIGPAETAQLSIEIREQPALQQGIF